MIKNITNINDLFTDPYVKLVDETFPADMSKNVVALAVRLEKIDNAADIVTEKTGQAVAEKAPCVAECRAQRHSLLSWLSMT